MLTPTEVPLSQEGDLYDPAGTVTGGSAPKSGNTLMKLQELLGISESDTGSVDGWGWLVIQATLGS